LASLAVELGFVRAEIALAEAMPLCAGTGALAPVCEGAVVTSEIAVMGAGILLVDIDVAYWSYTYHVAQAGGRYPVGFELFPPWGLGR
jgi:hypothetical protein